MNGNIMKTHQTGIVENNTSSALFMLFDIANENNLATSLAALKTLVNGKDTVAGFGNKLMQYFAGVSEYHQHKFNSPLMSNDDGCDLAIWIKHEDKGEIFHKSQALKNALADSFTLQKTVSAYSYRQKFDLSGFEDGIENPKGNEILPVAIVADGELAGSSFWVLQQWLHDFTWLNAHSKAEKETCIGRSLDEDSHQLDNLAEFAHIKKAAKENFTPEAELLRKSMPWSDDNLNGGFMFSAFANTFRSFNLQMASMLGIDDGIVDGVFKFSKIMNTNYLWCPPIKNGTLDISLFDKK